MAGRAIAGVARHAKRRSCVAIKPTLNQVWFSDEWTRKRNVLNLCFFKDLVDFLNGAQTTNQHDRHIYECGQRHGSSMEIPFVTSCLDTFVRRSVAAHLNGINSCIYHKLARYEEVLYRQPTWVFIGGIDLHGDDEIVTRLAAHVLQYFIEDASTATLVTTVAVCAVIDKRTDKFAQVEEVSGMNL